tara:strand:+ start:2938 stop:3759 length:822 start_codon:yes stop_codon:yes gene_type:complete
MKKFSVVVCSKNESKKIIKCLKGIKYNKPNELLLIDDSTDDTRQIAKKYCDKIISGGSKGLSYARQVGLNNAKYNYVVMIDSDHILKKNQIKKLFSEMKKFNFDIIQAQINIIKMNFFTRAENEGYNLVHNLPGQKKMIGTAPAIFNKSKLKHIKFDNKITKTIDDTDFYYRLHEMGKNKFGIGDTKIDCYHDPYFFSYIKKFYWYGKGDAEFCYKYKSKILSMSYHLIIRYMFIYSIKALVSLKFIAIPYFIVQGFIRAVSLYLNFFRLIVT